MSMETENAYIRVVLRRYLREYPQKISPQDLVQKMMHFYPDCKRWQVAAVIQGLVDQGELTLRLASATNGEGAVFDGYFKG